MQSLSALSVSEIQIQVVIQPELLELFWLLKHWTLCAVDSECYNRFRNISWDVQMQPYAPSISTWDFQKEHAPRLLLQDSVPLSQQVYLSVSLCCAVVQKNVAMSSKRTQTIPESLAHVRWACMFRQPHTADLQHQHDGQQHNR